MKARMMQTILVSAVLAGCAAPMAGAPESGAPTAAAGTPSFSRPRELALDGLDPCALLTPAQLKQLGVGQESRGTATSFTDGRQFPSCQWARFPQEPQDSYLIGNDLNRGVQFSLVGAAGVQVIKVAGFAAVEYEDGGGRPHRNCVLAIDIAAGQNLIVRYDYNGSTVPMNRQLACEKAKVAAEMAIQTLIEQADG